MLRISRISRFSRFSRFSKRWASENGDRHYTGSRHSKIIVNTFGHHFIIFIATIETLVELDHLGTLKTEIHLFIFQNILSRISRISRILRFSRFSRYWHSDFRNNERSNQKSDRVTICALPCSPASCWRQIEISSQLLELIKLVRVRFVANFANFAKIAKIATARTKIFEFWLRSVGGLMLVHHPAKFHCHRVGGSYFVRSILTASKILGFRSWTPLAGQLCLLHL